MSNEGMAAMMWQNDTAVTIILAQCTALKGGMYRIQNVNQVRGRTQENI